MDGRNVYRPTPHSCIKKTPASARRVFWRSAFANDRHAFASGAGSPVGTILLGWKLAAEARRTPSDNGAVDAKTVRSHLANCARPRWRRDQDFSSPLGRGGRLSAQLE